MVLLVFVHGYNLEPRYLQPWTVPSESLTVNTFIQYWLANGLLRFRIPMLFVISGYLFALGEGRQPHGERMKKRTRTLLLPYLLWSAFALALTYGLELIPYTRQLVYSSAVVQITAQKVLIHDYAWYEVVARWLLSPVAYQLWFIRVLLVYNLAYPVICWCVTHGRARNIYFPVLVLLWFATFGIGFLEGEGLLFFSLGVWLQKHNFDIINPGKVLRPLPWMVAFLLLSVLKTLLAFKGLAWMGNNVYLVLTVLHKMVVGFGLIACWFGLDALVRWCMARRWFVWLSAFSFIIYALHTPLIAFAINGSFDWLQPLPGYRLITFLVLPLVTIGVCICFGVLLRRFLPKVYAVLTGNRGLAI